MKGVVEGPVETLQKQGEPGEGEGEEYLEPPVEKKLKTRPLYFPNQYDMEIDPNSQVQNPPAQILRKPKPQIQKVKDAPGQYTQGQMDQINEIVGHYSKGRPSMLQKKPAWEKNPIALSRNDIPLAKQGGTSEAKSGNIVPSSEILRESGPPLALGSNNISGSKNYIFGFLQSQKPYAARNIEDKVGLEPNQPEISEKRELVQNLATQVDSGEPDNLKSLAEFLQGENPFAFVEDYFQGVVDNVGNGEGTEVASNLDLPFNPWAASGPEDEDG
ncbi:hypothetical protein ABW20_dc0100593 [Dactylellina cionopaga]|nr:hypothetical protein ABW20_dc0100593 [Dactylellina cionopaga]